MREPGRAGTMFERQVHGPAAVKKKTKVTQMNRWITVWSQSHTNISTVTPRYRNRTMWLTVPTAVAGDRVRLRISNTEGCTKLQVVQAAICAEGGKRQPLLFSGKEWLELKTGEECYSDEISINVAPGQNLSVFAAFRGEATSGSCIHAHVQCSKNGNFVYAPQMDISRRSLLDSYWGNLPGIPAIAAVEVLTAEKPEVIACFGDSITQQSTWTVPLEQMLNSDGYRAIVLNAGIGGNRLLLGPPEPALQVFGPAAKERFERDVLGIEGITAVIFAMGTNDIGWIRKPEEIGTAGANAIFAELKLLAGKAHEKGLTVYGATLTPRNGSLDYGLAQEQERLRLNEMIRSGGCFDGVIDFAQAVADAADPGILAPYCASGDHLHPSALGGEKMAACAKNAISRKQHRPENPMQ